MPTTLPPTLPDIPTQTPALTRPSIPYLPLPLLNDPFILSDLKTRNYKTQYANIYYTRLLRLRPGVGKVAGERWAGTRGESTRRGRGRDRKREKEAERERD